MKNLILISVVILMSGCSGKENIPEDIKIMTDKLISFKSQLTECDTLKSCEKIMTDMNSYLIEVNHPDNQGQLCNKYPKCYEASVDLLQNGLPEYMNKITSLTLQ